jgi:hypothetical protein
MASSLVFIHLNDKQGPGPVRIAQMDGWEFSHKPQIARMARMRGGFERFFICGIWDICGGLQ